MGAVGRVGEEAMTRFIIVLGCSFSGSTLLDMVLSAAVPGMIGVGEAHWLVDWKDGEHLQCVCNGLIDCPLSSILARARQREISAQDTYLSLAVELGDPPYLLTTDKYYTFVQRMTGHLPDEAFDTILMWKHPLRAWSSEIKHWGDRKSHDYLRIWEIINEKALKFNPAVVVSYWRFCLQTNRELQRICVELDLPYSPKWNNWHEPQRLHKIRGNTPIMARIMRGERTITLDQSYHDVLSEEQKQEAVAFAEHSSVFADLERSSW